MEELKDFIKGLEEGFFWSIQVSKLVAIVVGVYYLACYAIKYF